jgi:hypothetical protein
MIVIRNTLMSKHALAWRPRLRRFEIESHLLIVLTSQAAIVISQACKMAYFTTSFGKEATVASP